MPSLLVSRGTVAVSVGIVDVSVEHQRLGSIRNAIQVRVLRSGAACRPRGELHRITVVPQQLNEVGHTIT